VVDEGSNRLVSQQDMVDLEQAPEYVLFKLFKYLTGPTPSLRTLRVFEEFCDGRMII
jgi:hypothetical protein